MGMRSETWVELFAVRENNVFAASPAFALVDHLEHRALWLCRGCPGCFFSQRLTAQVATVCLTRSPHLSWVKAGVQLTAWHRCEWQQQYSAQLTGHQQEQAGRCWGRKNNNLRVGGVEIPAWGGDAGRKSEWRMPWVTPRHHNCAAACSASLQLGPVLASLRQWQERNPGCCLRPSAHGDLDLPGEQGLTGRPASKQIFRCLVGFYHHSWLFFSDTPCTFKSSHLEASQSETACFNSQKPFWVLHCSIFTSLLALWWHRPQRLKPAKEPVCCTDGFQRKTVISFPASLLWYL